MKRPLRALIAAVCLCSSLRTARALTDEETFRDLRFDFPAPGARAMALGGAFVGVADDPTAADANPAGLATLQRSQFFVGIRSAAGGDAATTRSSLGSLAVNPVTGARDLPYLDLSARSEADSSVVPDFIGYVWPLAFGSEAHRLTVAGSRQVILSARRTLPGSGEQTVARFSFDSFPNTVSGGEVVAYSIATPVTGSIEADVVHWNASAAYAIQQDFSVGVTLTYATLDLQSVNLTQVIDPLGLYVDPGHPRLPSQPGSDLYETSIDDTDSAFTYTIGLQWHPVSPFPDGESPWRLGAAIRKGAQFGVSESTRLNGVADPSFQTNFNVPDRYSVGGSYALGKRWLFALQLERVEYSDQLEGFRSGVNFFTSGSVSDSSFATDPSTPVTFTVDDGTFFRAGAEYVLPVGGAQKRDLALRAGYYRSPDNRIRMTQFNSTDPAVNAMYLNAFPGGEDANHVTAGVGYALGSSSFHLAFDASSRDGNQIVASYALILGAKKK